MTANTHLADQSLASKLKIPPQPEILNLVYNEINRKSPDIKMISEKIAQDGGLYSSILRLINSPFFGLRAEVTSVNHAITLIGLPKLAANIASIKLRSEMDNAGFPPMPRYWDTSFNQARLASKIARELKLNCEHDCYLLGMFEDTGIPILSQRHDNYKDILRYQNENDQACYTDYENRLLNTNHAVVGYLVMRSWGLNENLRQACLNHHDLDFITAEKSACPDAQKLILVMKIARHILLTWRSEMDFEWPRIKDFTLFYFGLSEHDFFELEQQMLDFLSTDGI